MLKSFKLRTGLLASAFFVLGSPTAFAQQQTDPTEVDEIIVTGSRIATSPENAAQPVQQITAETLALQGLTSVSDALDQLPALQASSSSAQANGSAATLNLRGMGTNRTLVLVDGRRHVAGVQGSAAVDVSTIPSGLVERIEVLTGGASAVYGSDAVTGVVNFILKDDFVGTEFDIQAGISSEGDSEQIFGSVLHGMDFDNGRGNVALAIQASKSEALFYGDRDFSRDNRTANDYPNPARVFQLGDPLPPGVSLAAAQGRSILLASGAPRFANTDPALIARATSAAQRTYYADPRFAIASIGGLIGYDPYGFGFAGGPGDFATAPDLDGNGVADCLQSVGGRGTGGGFPVGCWVTDPVTGQVRPFQDGQIGAFTNHSGGDGSPETFNNQSLLPEETSLNLNLLFNYEISPLFKPYAELKYAYNRGVTFNPYNTFDDSIPIALDNPFIPDSIRAVIDAEIAAGNGDENALVTIGRDNIDLFDPRASNVRETYRAVVGVEGEFSNGWTYDVSVNAGKTAQEARSQTRLEDRYFAAIDAVIDPATGQAVCRSTLDPTAFPRYSYLTDTANFAPGATLEPVGGFTTFTPGAGSDCRPLNLFGVGVASQEALDFLAYESISRSTIEQLVISATLVGDSEQWFSLPGGPIGFATGIEYREESSEFIPDAFDQLGYGFQYQTTPITEGEFDVSEAFLELSFPLLADLPFAEVLTVNVAGRIGEYSTIGQSSTYKIDGIWAPISDIRFRAGYASTVRAPNIGELFSPLTSATYRPVDPCDQANIGLGTAPDNREANCRLDLGIAPGAAYTFSDPLTARFTGQAGGNPNLEEEEAESITIGLVLQPRFVPNFSLTVDYWDIKIENAIAAVTAQDIVNSCYDAPTLDNQFCDLFSRNRNEASPTFLGFNSLTQTQLNFSSLEASGIDFQARYEQDLTFLHPRLGSLSGSIAGTWLEDRNNYPFVAEPERANPVKLEQSFPEWAFNTTIQWQLDDLTLSFFSNYQSKQALGSTPIEDIEAYDPQFSDEFWSHSASMRWDFKDGYAATLGVNNITDESPYLSSVATPVSPIGRTVFLRVSGAF